MSTLATVTIGISVASFVCSVMVFTIAHYEQKTNYHKRWNRGEVIGIYRDRMESTKGYRAEAKGGLKTCLAIVDAGVKRQPCDRFDISLIR